MGDAYDGWSPIVGMPFDGIPSDDLLCGVRNQCKNVSPVGITYTTGPVGSDGDVETIEVLVLNNNNKKVEITIEIFDIKHCPKKRVHHRTFHVDPCCMKEKEFKKIPFEYEVQITTNEKENVFITVYGEDDEEQLDSFTYRHTELAIINPLLNCIPTSTHCP